MKERFEIHITDLPIGLICFPLMLLYLSILSVWGAVLCLIGTAIPLFVRTYLRGFRESFNVSMWVLSLMVLILISGELLVLKCDGTGLSHQLLWMVGFVITHTIFSILVRAKHFPKFFTSSCCCDKLRNNTLLAEYKRFEHILYHISLYSLAICIPLVVLFRLTREFEVFIMGFIAFLSLGAIILELFHLSWLRRRLSQENWIQVLDEQNNVVDRVAYTNVAEYSKAGIFPMVRLLLVSQGMVYLEKTCLCNNLGVECYDTPLVDWLNEGATPEEVSRRMMDSVLYHTRKVQPHRITSYKIQLHDREYLVYLFVVQIEKPNYLCVHCNPLEGKWWGIQLLKDSISQGEFSPHISSELPLIEQTIMLAQKLAKQYKQK